MKASEAPAEAFPLAWPDGWERTPAHKRTRSRFDVTETWARDHLVDQVRLLGGRGLVLSTNLTTRRDGLPYVNQRQPDDPGVAVYWLTRDNEWRVVACDRWERVWENMRAIGLTLEALRGVDRWGASGILDRVFAGFAALPAPETQRAWWEALGVPKTATLIEAREAYRQLAKTLHPDRGGTVEQMAELNAAWDRAKDEVTE